MAKTRRPSGFERLRKPDSQGRIAIGKEFAGETYLVDPQSNGDIILRPYIVMPKREAWLFANQDALASVKRGITEAERGDVHDLGSFAQKIGDDQDEED